MTQGAARRVSAVRLGPPSGPLRDGRGGVAPL